MKKELIFKKTKAQLEREKRNKENLKRSIAELKAIVLRIKKRREQLRNELQNERHFQKA